MRVVSSVAWGGCALFFCLLTGIGYFVAFGSGPLDQFVLVLLASGCALVGALVASRQPRNGVGWLLLVIAISLALQGVTDSYVRRPGAPLAAHVSWVSSWIWYFWLYSAGLLLPLLFPDGRLLSRRWRVAFWCGLAAVASSVLSPALMPGRMDTDAPVPLDNPFGAPVSFTPLLRGLDVLGGSLAAVGVVLGVASLALRLRRSTGRERQQVALFVYVGALGLLGFALAILGVFGTSLDEDHPPLWAVVAGNVGWFTALGMLTVGLPLTVGVAILRHRLYDIDVVVKRTLVYGSLTALLATTYLVLVLVLRLVLDPLAGTSDLAVAGSTLAVAALFQPARRRVQLVVDRRFFRSPYDAELTVERFSGRLREMVELDSISEDLREVVAGTLAPTEVTLWLRSTR